MIDADIFSAFAKENSPDEAVRKFVNPQKDEKPLAIQLGGANVSNLLYAMEILQPYADLYDYNIGCPLGYMLGKKGGCYLMKHPDQLYKIVAQLSKVCKPKGIPLTVKMRSGWDTESINAHEIAPQLEKLGVDAITLHPRTRKQGYRDRADWVLARKVKDLLTIPLILSGDVTNSYMAHMAFTHVKCDFVMVGRAAKNNPSVFLELNEYLASGKEPVKPDKAYGKKTSQARKDWGEFLGLYKEREHRFLLSELKDHALWMAKECRNNAKVTEHILKAKNENDLTLIFGSISFG